MKTHRSQRDIIKFDLARERDEHVGDVEKRFGEATP